MRRDVQEIFRQTPHEKQVMMFSATLSKEVRPVCKKFMQDVNTSNSTKSPKTEFIPLRARLPVGPSLSPYQPAKQAKSHQTKPKKPLETKNKKTRTWETNFFKFQLAPVPQFSGDKKRQTLLGSAKQRFSHPVVVRREL